MDDLEYLPYITGMVFFVCVMIIAIYLEVTKDKR